MSADERTKRYVWVRCGGRCVICKKYLLLEEFDTGAAVRAIGEVAHIAGESEAGPRGESSVPTGERNDPDNLILLCPNDHRAADKKRLKDPQYTEAYLNQLKLEHEAFVEFATGLSAVRTTTILRVFGGIRTAPGNVARDEAATVVMNHALRVPRYLPDPSGVGVEIDLRSVPDPIDAGYWSGSLRQIDAGIERLHRDVVENNTTHVSVFAITLLPLLVALGNRLDDTVAVDVYERHRSSDSWSWSTDAPVVPFGLAEASGEVSGADEAVMVVNASGTIQWGELPEVLRGLVGFTVAPADGTTPSTSTFENADTLAGFEGVLRSFFAHLEANHKHIRRLHLFAAAPVSAAVTIGRTIPVDNAAPSVAIYHRTANTYEHVLDLPA